ncbi:MAG: DivIVA domain-containing protein, partial [Actinomycetes bacterium]
MSVTLKNPQFAYPEWRRINFCAASEWQQKGFFIMNYERDIERKDFPLSRRGYDPAAVDAHLARLATEIRDETRRTTPISENVSRQIKSIISVAEDA